MRNLICVHAQRKAAGEVSGVVIRTFVWPGIR